MTAYIALISGLFFLGVTAVPTVSAETPNSFSCQFEVGSKLHVDHSKQVEVEKSNGQKHRFIFSGLNNSSNVGVYRNLNMGWEGRMSVMKNQEKIDLVETNISDNGFVVTIFVTKKFDNQIPAIYSNHSFVFDIEGLELSQLIGACE
jgi:hypothetical protein